MKCLSFDERDLSVWCIVCLSICLVCLLYPSVCLSVWFVCLSVWFVCLSVETKNDTVTSVELVNTIFFRDCFACTFVCLTLIFSCRFADIYSQFGGTIDAANSAEDLEWYSQNFGANMPMNWPKFEVTQTFGIV